MAKKIPQIFYIDNKEEEFNLIRAIHKQFKKGKNSEVITAAADAIYKFPKNEFFYVIASLAFLELDQPMNAMKILLEADKIIPNDFQIKFHLAKTFENFHDLLNAEKNYKSALECVDAKDANSISNIYNDLGVLLMDQRRNDEALECWKSALMENPNNINAQSNLRNFSNHFRKRNTTKGAFEDMLNFQSIQTAKYFTHKNKSEFENRSEFELFINQTMAAWNYYISPNSKKLVSLSIEEKSEWFRSIEIPFKNFSTNLNNEKIYHQKKRTKNIKKPKEPNDLKNSNWEEVNRIFSFLPEQGLIMVMYGSAALLAAGMPGDRYMEILNTGIYDKEEQELMYWAFEITVLLLQSLIENNEIEKISLLEEAKDLAEEFLDIDDVDYVIALIQTTLKKEFIDKPKAEKKSKK